MIEMRKNFKDLRLKQLARNLEVFAPASKVPRPPMGWVRAMRQALGISASELGRSLGRSRQLPLQLEKAEASDAITLKSLRSVANAMGCDLVYALVPRSGSIQDLRKARATALAREHVLRVEHSMALEDQASGHLDEAVEAEAERHEKATGA
jgi:predicted DNA-binding mobile mystery protein A